MNKCSPFNPIKLTFFDVSSAFHINIEVVYTVWHIFDLIFVGKCMWHLKKINVIRLKRLYSFIFKVYESKCIKVLNKNEFQF